MGFIYQNLRRAAYQLTPAEEPLVAKYQTLAFPEQLTSGVLRVCNLGRTGEEPFRTAPIHRLNGVLQALASDVAVMARGPVDAYQAHQWLYCPEDRPNPLPEQVLHHLLRVWVEELRPEDVYRGDVRDLLAELKADPPAWSDVDVPLLRTKQSLGGTAMPNNLQYLLVTDYFARRIQQLPPYQSGTHALRFHAVARGARQQGAELMSQPLPYEDGGNTWWFSVIINLTLHTVPFDPLPKLHLHLGLRRWATLPDRDSGRLRLGFGADTSVYLRPVEPWLPGAPVSDRYGVARLTWDRDARVHQWRQGDPAGMLGRLSLNRPFPDVAELLSQPAAWLNRTRGTDALVVHSTRMGSHGVAAGLMPHQRSQIVAWAEQALFPELTRVPDLRRSRLDPDTPTNLREKPSGDEREEAEQRAASARRASIAQQCPRRTDYATPVFEPRLLWRSAKCRDLAIQGLVTTLKLPGNGGAMDLTKGAFEQDEPVVLTWMTEELVVRLRCLRLGQGLGDSLDIDPKSKTKRADHAGAFRRRRQAMAKFLAADGASVVVPELAVVELAPRRVFGNRENDPKFPLRLGAADAGVITQFIADRMPAKTHSAARDASRARSAWMDGFRQLGASVVPVPLVEHGLPSGTQYLAIWMASRRRDSPSRPGRKFPVAVLVRPGATGPDAVLGWDPEAFQGVGAWTRYPRFLTRLPDLVSIQPEDIVATSGEERMPWPAYQRKMEERRRETERFVQKILYSPEVRAHPTVLLAHSQNARQLWTWLQDGIVIKDLIRTGQASAAGLNPWMRLVRVRTGDQRETAQWWGIGKPSGVNGLSAGLWDQPDENDELPTDARLFYSTSAKATSFKDSAVEADKLSPRPMRRGKSAGTLTIDTDKPGWNPNLVEIAVLGCHPDDGDVPDAIAMAVHQLRQAPDYLDALRLPLPSHLAALAQEYVLPMATVDDEQEEDEEMKDPEQIEADALPDDTQED